MLKTSLCLPRPRLRRRAVWLVALLAAYSLMPGQLPSLLRTVNSEGRASAPGPSPAVLSLPDRAARQRAVDEVYWRHTVWPEAGGAKPSLSAVMPAEAGREKAEEALRKSEALRRLWKQEITAGMLQAEIDRMARHSKRPELLRELFASLDDDPYLVAEVLARPALADRLLRSFHAADERFRSEPNFDEWWRRARGDFSAPQAPARAAYRLSAVPPAQSQADDTWRPMSALPAATGTAVWTGTEMIVWGGGTNSGSRYNPATDTWTPTSTINAPSNRSRHTAVWTGTEMIVWGGCNQSGSFCGESTGGRYDPRTDTWTPTSNVDAPRPRRDHTAVWTGAEMIVWGGCHPGYVGSCNRVSSGGGGAYNPSTDTWRAISTLNAPEGRTKHTAVWTGTEMVVWGGVATNITNTGGRYNPATDSWRHTSLDNAPSPRMEHTAVWTGSVMVVWGGYDGGSGSFNTGGRYDPASDTWATTSLVNAPPGRIGHTAVWTGTEMIVWGGDLRFSLGLTKTGGRYRPDTDTWTPTNQTNAPSPRAYHVSVWTGSLMLVWSTADRKSGGRYDPASDSWTPTNNRDSSPSVYQGVWTGAEMLVWGANPGCLSGCAGVGGRYDPALDAWRPMNLSGAPRGPARDRPITAVWTGTEMIVWGMAGDVAGAPGEGGRYNPSTDSWAPVTNTGAPLNRFYHTAVWTGTEMVVWGGQDNQGTLLASGGRYNPATNSWRPTGAVNAPDARYIHTSVWTGTEMVVWGGVGGIGHLNSGGRYNPSTDTWRPTATNNAPAARRYHTAVWTGAEMIVWGGRDGDYNNNELIFDTGGRYNPSADTWQQTNMAGAPLARFRHTAVWTGAEMVVWGGLAKTGVAQREVSTGARYDPASDSWTPTSLLRAPSARSAHVALWTGSGMIIWGGDRSPYTGTETHGAIYSAPGGAAPTPSPTPSPSPTPTPGTTQPPPPPVNHALAANGATATASTTLDAGRAPAAVINGDRRGIHWGSDPATGSGWHDATGSAFPDWLEVSFSGPKSVSEVHVFSVQDNPSAPQEPTATMSFTKYGVTGFQVEYWTGSAWQVVTNGLVVSNSNVWAKVTFAPLVTSKVRVVVNSAQAGYSRLAEVEAWGAASAGPARVNVAAAANGATASASSTLDAGRSAPAAVNGDRRGLHWGTDPSTGSGWHDATGGAFPDWLEVNFGGTKSISEVHVFSLQDNLSAPVEPTAATTFTKYGLQDFDVEYWTGSAWQVVPGGAVVGNSKVWRALSFAPLVTSKVRVVVRKGAGGYSRVVEVEAY